jgi:hypothetical protein
MREATDVSFRVFVMDRAELQNNTWTDCATTYKLGEVHVGIRRSIDARERHLYGDEAKEFLRLLGAPDCWRPA